MSETFSIADMPVVDDLQVPVDPTEYADQANPAPAAPGIYRFAVVKIAPKTTKEGQLVLTDGKYPVLNLAQVKIVFPTESERGVGLFQDIKTKPGLRKGNRGQDIAFNELWDLLRSFDASVGIDGFEHAKQLLQQYVDGGTTFVGSLGWTARDTDYIDAEFKKLGADTFGARRGVAKELANAIYNKASLNTKNFVVNGRRVASVVGPSGNMIEARPKIQRFYPSHIAQDGVMVPNPEFDRPAFFGAFKK